MEMNLKEKGDRGSMERFICPVTGLPVLRRPEWTDVNFGKDYTLTVSLVGERILLAQLSGYATMDDVKNGLEFISEIVRGALPEGKPYIKIADFTNLSGASLEGRKYYIDYTKNCEEMLGLVFYGLSTLFKISIALARRLNIAPMKVQLAKDYSEAVNLAVKMLSNNHTLPAVSSSSPPDENLPKDWHLRLEGFSMRMGVIHENILHAVSTGFLEESYVPYITKLREHVKNAVCPVKDFDYIIAGVKDVKGASMRGRRLYMNSMKDWFKLHPFRLLIFYGMNRFMRTAVSLGRHLVPFKIRTAKDLDDALKLIREYEDKTVKNHTGLSGKRRDRRRFFLSSTRRYIDDLLSYLGRIDWEAEGVGRSELTDSSHPFRPVFDAIDMIKGDLDDLLREKELAEAALQKSRDDSEKRVQERTAKLIKANERLRAEIKERKAAVTSRMESEDRFRLIADLSPFPISIIDTEGRYIYLNPKFSEVFGYTLDDITYGRDWFRKAYPDPEYRRNVVTAWISDLQNKYIYGFRGREFQVVCKDGTVRTILFKPLSMKDGKQFVVYEDLTEQRRSADELKRAFEKLRNTQAQLVQSGKLASIGQLASGVAHELNQPLMVIRAMAQMMKRRQNRGELGAAELTEHVEPIERNTKRMMNIINHLRTFSRQSQSDFKPVDVNTIIEDSLLMVGEQLRIRNVELRKDLDKALPRVRGDANQLEQVFLNLITNARDAVEEKLRNHPDSDAQGTIEVITRDGGTSGGFIEMLITDKGGGISDEHLDKIFDPFFTTKDVGMGTGLGLSISYGIIKDHQGEIEVTETGPAGTTFRIRLPISKS